MPLTAAAIRPRASAIPAAVTLALAIPAYAELLLGDAEGAFVALILLWLLLSVLLVLGAARGWMPRWAAFASCAVLPLSAWGALLCLARVTEGPPAPDIESCWPWAILASLPVLLALYAFWAHFPRVQRVLRPTPVSCLVLCAAVVLSVAPIAMPEAATVAAASPAPEPDIPVDSPAPVPGATRDEPGDLAARLAQLTPDSPLADFLPFLVAGGDLKREALARARLLTTRQDDAEALLRQGQLDRLEDLGGLDLAATPALCAAFGHALTEEAARDRDGEGYWLVADRLEIHLGTMNWLVAAGCDLAAPLHAVADTAGSYPDSPERARFLVAIDALLAPPVVVSGGVVSGAVAPGAVAAGDPARCLAGDPGAPDQTIAGCTAIIRSGRAGFARLSAALITRGNAFYATGALDRAIADYTAALRFGGDDSVRGAAGQAAVLTNRANARDAQGDRAGALRDYDAAIQRDPTLAMAFNDRGASAQFHDDNEHAIADFDAALRLDPTYATAYANRGRAYFFLGRLADAAWDFEQARARAPGDLTILLWRMLAQTGVGQAAAARTAARTDTAAADKSAWPWPLVAVYLGEHDIAWGQKQAVAGAGNAAGRAGRVCEAAFYLGEKTLLDGARATALPLLRQAASGCTPRSVEAASARTELGRIGG